jgi:ABC-type multidrug transport system fused ATPase/permease subunit
VVSDARVLILDEPAAHLDPSAVTRLHERLRDESATRAVLVIAHSLNGLERYSEIAVLAGGRITERGTHAELLADGGWYARTALTQAAALAP